MPEATEASGANQWCGAGSGKALRETVRGSGAVVGGARTGFLRGGSCAGVLARADAWCRPRGLESIRSPWWVTREPAGRTCRGEPWETARVEADARWWCSQSVVEV